MAILRPILGIVLQNEKNTLGAKCVKILSGSKAMAYDWLKKSFSCL